MSILARARYSAHTHLAAASLSHLSCRRTITDTTRFRDVYHNTDSIDQLQQISKKPIDRMDKTKRATYYLMLGTSYACALSFVRNYVRQLITYVNQPADVIAASTTELDLSNIPEGKCLVISHADAPYFIWHRDDATISRVRSEDWTGFRDPQPDEDRVKDPKWLICKGMCTHLGCVPVHGEGLFGGFFCPCHGSHYDGSGRIRRGPAPLNLHIPNYEFLNDNTVLIS